MPKIVYSGCEELTVFRLLLIWLSCVVIEQFVPGICFPLSRGKMKMTYKYTMEGYQLR